MPVVVCDRAFSVDLCGQLERGEHAWPLRAERKGFRLPEMTPRKSQIFAWGARLWEGGAVHVPQSGPSMSTIPEP